MCWLRSVGIDNQEETDPPAARLYEEKVWHSLPIIGMKRYIYIYEICFKQYK